MFSNCGGLSWLAYAVGTVMLLLVAFNLNQFAKRSTHAGSMYRYASAGLGFGGGALCGWCLVWAYGFIGLAGTTGFAIFAGKLLGMIHVEAPPVLLFSLCLGVSFLLAYKDIKISTLVMLGLEAFSCFFILVLCVVVFAHPDAGAVTLALLFGLFNLIAGATLITRGVELRRTGKTLHSIVPKAA